MPRALSACLILLFALSSGLQLRAQSAECPPAELRYKSTDPAYGDAMNVQTMLEAAGLKVNCIFETKLSNQFMRDENGMRRFTLKGEACFRTNYGDISAFFAPKPQTFSALTIHEHRKRHGYLYTFSGMPDVWVLNQFGSVARLYYFKRDNYLLSVADGPLRAKVEEAIGAPLSP